MGLDAASAREALRLFGRGKMSQAAIARKFDVSRTTINDLVHGRSWKHLAKRPRPRDAAEAVFARLTPAPSDWIARAVEVVRRVASMRDEFTADDVWDEIDRPEGADPRAMGDAMRLAHKEGFCEPTARVRPNPRNPNNRPQRVWRSL